MPKIIITLMVIAAIYGLMSETKTPQKNQINVQAQREITSLVSAKDIDELKKQNEEFKKIISDQDEYERLEKEREELKKKVLMTTLETK